MKAISASRLTFGSDCSPIGLDVCMCLYWAFINDSTAVPLPPLMLGGRTLYAVINICYVLVCRISSTLQQTGVNLSTYLRVAHGVSLTAGDGCRIIREICSTLSD